MSDNEQNSTKKLPVWVSDDGIIMIRKNREGYAVYLGGPSPFFYLGQQAALGTLGRSMLEADDFFRRLSRSSEAGGDDPEDHS